MKNIGLVHCKQACWCHLTHHAVEQYISRWASNKTYDEATNELFSLLNTSAPHGKTILGDTIFISGHRPSIRMVIKDKNVCVTVLPVSSSEQDMLDEMQRIASLVEEAKEEINNEMYHLLQEKEKLITSKKELDKLLQPINNRIYILNTKLHRM